MSDANLRTGLWKKESDKGSYYSGSVEIGGVAYWVNLYKNDRKEQDSHPDLNLVLKPKEQRRELPPAGRQAQRAAHAPVDDFVDDPSIPF
jgi:hypothetical protein